MKTAQIATLLCVAYTAGTYVEAVAYDKHPHRGGGKGLRSFSKPSTEDDATNFESFCKKHIHDVRQFNTARGVSNDLEARQLDAPCPRDHYRALASGSPDFQLVADKFIKEVLVNAMHIACGNRIPSQKDSLRQFMKAHLEFIKETGDEKSDTISGPFRKIHQSLETAVNTSLKKLDPSTYLTVVAWHLQAILWTKAIYKEDDSIRGKIYLIINASLSRSEHGQEFKGLPNIMAPSPSMKG